MTIVYLDPRGMRNSRTWRLELNALNAETETMMV